jgi:hypothetical protein
MLGQSPGNNHVTFEVMNLTGQSLEGDGKGKGVPCRAHMAYWGRGGVAPIFLNLGAGVRGWVVSSALLPHSPPGKVPGTHCGRLGGPQSRLDLEGRGKIFRLRRGSNPVRPVRSQPLYRLSWAEMGMWKLHFVVRVAVLLRVVPDTYFTWNDRNICITSPSVFFVSHNVSFQNIGTSI